MKHHEADWAKQQPLYEEVKVEFPGGDDLQWLATFYERFWVDTAKLCPYFRSKYAEDELFACLFFVDFDLMREIKIFIPREA